MTAVLEPCTATRTLVVDARGRWFAVDGAPPVELANRPVLRVIFEKLLSERVHAPGSPLPMRALIAVGWANDRSLTASIQNRLCVAIASLRKLGLGDVLISQRRKGYFLDPSVEIEWALSLEG
jgi:hypothetical protein